MDLRLLWLAIGAFASGTEGFVIGALLPSIGEGTSVSLAQAANVVLVYSFANGILAPLLLASRIGAGDRRRLIPVASLLFATGAVIIAIAPDFIWVIVGRTLVGCGAGLYAALAIATAVALSPPERRGRAVATVTTGTSIAVLLGAPLGAWVGVTFGWRATYWAIAGLGIFSCVLIASLLPSGITGQRRSLVQQFAVLKLPGILPTLAGTALIMTSGFMVVTFIAAIAMQAMGIAKSLMPLVLFVYGIGAVLGNPLGGQLSDRIGARRTTILTVIAQAVLMVVLPLIPLLPQPAVMPVYMLHLALTAIVGWVFFVAQLSRIGALAGPAAPLAISLNGTALNVGTAAAAIVGGQVLEQLGVNAIGIVAAAFALAALGALLIGRARQPASAV